MILNKWNFQTKEYEPFDSPAKKIKLYTEDMDELVDCANCGKELKYGECYTSRTIHTDVGFGYGVCENCYQKELEEDKKYRE